MKIFKNRLVQLIGIELLFALITYLFFAVIWYTKILPFNVDLIFHIRRINELANNLKHLQMPMFNQYVGMPMGVATLTFYPWLNILPISLLIIVHVPPVQAIVFGFSLMLFIGLNIAYWAGLIVFKKVSLSLLFAYFYCVSTILLCFFYNSMDIGEISAYFYMPLVFFGWLFWIQHGKWKMMTCGLILVATCHIISLVILGVFLITVTLMFYRQLDKAKVINICKSLTIFVLVTATIWLPIAVLELSNKLVMTTSYQKFGFIKYGGGLIPHLLDFVVPFRLSDWTISDVIAIILGLCIWKHLSFGHKKLLIYSIIILIFTLNVPKVSPILLFEHTPFIIIQNSVRLALISHMILAYLLIYEIIYINSHVNKQSIFKILLECLILFSALYVFLGTLESDVFLGVQARPLQEELKHKSVFNTFQLNNRCLSYKKLYYTHDLTGSKYDYVPKSIKALNVDKHISILHPKVYQRGCNIYVYSHRLCRNTEIPYVIYNQQNYKFISKDHNVRIQRNNHMIKITNIHRGWNHIRVIEPVMYYRWIAIVASIIGIILLIIEVIRDFESEE